MWDTFGKSAQSAQWVVSELTQYLDIFYMDVEGWVKLTDMYAELNLCVQAFSATCVCGADAGPHACAAAHGAEPVPAAFVETAYTAGDMPLALKTYLCGCANNGFAQRFVGTKCTCWTCILM